jgi:hypothetical protein
VRIFLKGFVTEINEQITEFSVSIRKEGRAK